MFDAVVIDMHIFVKTHHIIHLKSVNSTVFILYLD